jgi:hypothetical protein
LASEHPVAPNPVSNGTGAIRNLFLDRDGSEDRAEPTAPDRQGAHARVRRVPPRRHGSRALVIPIGEVADASDVGARLARVVPVSRPPRPTWRSRLCRVAAGVRGRSRASTRAVRETGVGDGRWSGVAIARGFLLVVVVIVAVAALVQRDGARAARDDVRWQLAAAEQTAVELRDANCALSHERDRALAAARASARERSRAAATTRRWRRIATQRRGRANREQRKRR